MKYNPPQTEISFDFNGSDFFLTRIVFMGWILSCVRRTPPMELGFPPSLNLSQAPPEKQILCTKESFRTVGDKSWEVLYQEEKSLSVDFASREWNEKLRPHSFLSLSLGFSFLFLWTVALKNEHS